DVRDALSAYLKPYLRGWPCASPVAEFDDSRDAPPTRFSGLHVSCEQATLLYAIGAAVGCGSLRSPRTAGRFSVGASDECSAAVPADVLAVSWLRCEGHGPRADHGGLRESHR